MRSVGVRSSWREGVCTAYAISSRIWFTLLKGVLTEIYYPTVDRPQVRDLQYLITDGSTFFHEERRHLRSQTERIAPEALGYRVTNQDPDSRYTIVKGIIADPHAGAPISVWRMVRRELSPSSCRRP